MAGAGKKTFTAGETLTASDVNTYLMEQSVMYFAGTAARSSAIPTPSTGMTSYIGVTGTATIPQLETYTGSAWQTPYGLTQVANVSFTSATTITIDNVFTTAYSNYYFVGTWSAASATGVNIQFRTGGTTLATSVYTTQYTENSNTTFTGSRTINGTFTNATDVGPLLSHFYMHVLNPRVAGLTNINVDGGYNASSVVPIYQKRTGFVNDNAQFDGITFGTGVALTGNIRVYGLRNS